MTGEEKVRGFAEAARRAGISMGPTAASNAVPGIRLAALAAMRAEEAQQAAMLWCYHLGGLDPHKVANMTLAEFAEMCVKNIGMREPPEIPRQVLAGLRYLAKSPKTDPGSG